MQKQMYSRGLSLRVFAALLALLTVAYGCSNKLENKPSGMPNKSQSFEIQALENWCSQQVFARYSAIDGKLITTPVKRFLKLDWANTSSVTSPDGSGTRWVVPINDAITPATQTGGLAVKRYAVFSRKDVIAGYVVELYAKNQADLGKQLLGIINDLFSSSRRINNTFEGAAIVYDIRYNYLFGKEYVLGKAPIWGVHVKKTSTLTTAIKAGSTSKTQGVYEPDGDGNCGSGCTMFSVELTLGEFSYCDCPEPDQGSGSYGNGDGGYGPGGYGGGYGDGGYGNGGYGSGDGGYGNGGGVGYGPGEGGYYYFVNPGYGSGPYVPDPGYGGDVDPTTKLYEQLERDYRGRMSASEIAIFDNLTFYQRLLYLSNAEEAEQMSIQFYPGPGQDGGIGDAFRHAYFVVLNTHALGVNLAQSLSDAHEDRPLNSPLEVLAKYMDLQNNAVGIQVGLATIGAHDVITPVTKLAENGGLFMIVNANIVPTHL